MAKIIDVLKSFMGSTQPVYTRSQLTSPIINTKTQTEFMPMQLYELARRNYVSRKKINDLTPDDLSSTNLLNYFAPTAQNSIQLVQDAERIRELAPEIVQAETVMVSAIMAPNDFQTAQPYFTIGGTPYIRPELKDTICKYLKDYFVTQYRIDEKMTSWTKEALFRSGAAVTLILPEGTLTKMVKHMADNGNGQESFTIDPNEFTEEKYLQLLHKNVYSTSKPKTQGSEQIKSSVPSISINTKSATKNQNSKYVLDEDDLALAKGVESFLAQEYKDFPEEHRKKFLSGFEEITARLITTIEDGDVISISENPEVLRFGSAVRNYAKTKLNKNLSDLYKIDEHRNQIFNSDNDKLKETEQPLIDMTPFLTTLKEQKSHPFSIELPAESVIPICVPGSVEEKLGYFVLIDNLGHPIDAKNYLGANGGCSISGRITNAYTAMFGMKPTNMSGIRSPFMSATTNFAQVENIQDQAITKIFNYVLDEMLHRKLHNVGLRDVDMGKYETIATCMFYRLLEQKRTSLLFVPENLITYVAFDYRKDGSGKSLLESMEFMLSLRVTLYVANIMAMMRNAISKKDIEVTFDQKQTNYMAILEQVKNAVTQKLKFNLSYDPNNIAQSIISQNTSIRAFGQPNAPGFNVTSTDTQAQAVKADTDLLDNLDKNISVILGIPPSALNDLGNIEFARSLITQDLFFAKNTMNKQKILCDHTSDYCRSYLLYDPILMKGLKKIIEGRVTNYNVDGDENQELMTSVSPSTNDKQNIPYSKIITDIIKNLEIKLPAPNLAPGKAQNDIFNEYSDVINNVVDKFFPQEIVTNQSDTDAYNAFKAFIKSNLIKEYAVEMLPNINIKNIDDYWITARDEFFKTPRVVRNISKAIQQDNKARTSDKDQENNSSGSDFGGDMGFGGGDEFNFETGPTEDFGGGDFGSDMENTDFNFNTEPTETTTNIKTPTEENDLSLTDLAK